MPDYSVSKDFKIVWSHRQDSKANPNATFSASVNFSTSSYERTNIGNLYNSQLLTQNTKTSSISYSRTFPDIGLTLSGTTNISQTMKDSSVAITLPDLNITLTRRFPFKRKKAVGAERWYEKISFQYTGRLTNSIKTKDNLLFKSNLIKDWKNAMQHQIPISATFTLFKYFNLTPTFNYTERWYTNKTENYYDEEKRQWVATDTIYGFNRVSNYNFSLGLSTKLYGMYKPLFMKKKEIVDDVTMKRAITRITYEIIERNKNLDKIVLAGIKTRGVYIAQRIQERLKQLENLDVPLIELDTKAFRDDVKAEQDTSVFPIEIDGTDVILVDDVLYTGHTIRAAIDNIVSHGRPARVGLAVLVDRGHRELPIRADYVGKNIPTSESEEIEVLVAEVDGKDSVNIIDPS